MELQQWLSLISSFIVIEICILYLVGEKTSGRSRARIWVKTNTRAYEDHETEKNKEAEKLRIWTQGARLGIPDIKTVKIRPQIDIFKALTCGNDNGTKRPI